MDLVSYRRQYPGWLYPGRSDREPGEGAPRFPGVKYDLDAMSLSTWLRAAAQIRDERPDLLVLQWWTAFWAPHSLILLSRLRGPSRPHVLQVCHNATEHSPTRLKLLATRMVLSRADTVVSHSLSDADQLRGMIDGPRIVPLLHPTYDPFAANAPRPSKSEARRRIGVPEEGPLLLFFGFVRRYKGLMLLLDALRILRRDVPATLLVAGEFWEPRREYEDRIRELRIEGAVVLHDRYIPVQDLPDYFAAADLAVFPYTSTSQSGAVQMAAGFDCPFLTSDAGGLARCCVRNLVDHTFPSGDVEALADRMKSALDGDLRLGGASGPSWSEYARVIASVTDGPDPVPAELCMGSAS